jgi:hypothetical protein
MSNGTYDIIIIGSGARRRHAVSAPCLSYLIMSC